MNFYDYAYFMGAGGSKWEDSRANSWRDDSWGGNPLGSNPAFRACAKFGFPILRAITRTDWRGVENIPATGRAIVASNHISFSDPFCLTHFLYQSGRAPRFLGKASIFRIPLIGNLLLAAGQIPVERESKSAYKAFDEAVAALRAGDLIAIYPEGTLTRDSDSWPMVAKRGTARLAILTKTPVIPVVGWGPQQLWPPYSKRIRLWPKTKIIYRAGKALDLSPWYGRENDLLALEEATRVIMDTLCEMLEEIRQEKAPAQPFDLSGSGLPRTGNFRKAGKRERQ